MLRPGVRPPFDLDLRSGRLPRNLAALGARGVYVPSPATGSWRAVVQRYQGSPSTTSAHVRYLVKGKGVDGADAVLFTREGQEVDRRRFVQDSLEDPRQFRYVADVEAQHLHDPTPLIRRWMWQVEGDVNRMGLPRMTLDWVAAVHHDTPRTHTHVLIRGRSLEGHELLFAKHYYAHGLRYRLQQAQTRMLGPVPQQHAHERQRGRSISRSVSHNRTLGQERQYDRGER